MVLKPKRKCPLAYSAISVTVLISMTQKTVQHRPSCLTLHLIPTSMVAEKKNGHIVISVRYLATGQTVAMMTRLFNMRPLHLWKSITLSLEIYQPHQHSCAQASGKILQKKDYYFFSYKYAYRFPALAEKGLLLSTNEINLC